MRIGSWAAARRGTLSTAEGVSVRMTRVMMHASRRPEETWLQAYPNLEGCQGRHYPLLGKPTRREHHGSIVGWCAR